MKKASIIKSFAVVTFLTSACLLTGCLYSFNDKSAPPVQQNTIYYRPIYKTRSQLEQSIAVTEAQNLVNPGKIYLYGNYILVNEKYKGIHIIDNINPKNPNKIAFLGIAGNLDMAIRQNILYVDNAVDLVSIDFNELLIKKLKVLSRLKNNLPSLTSPDGGFNYNNYDNNIITDWVK